MIHEGDVIGLIKALSPKVDPSDISDAVEDWLDYHPEATTTVQDGAISYAKLNSDLKGSIDDITSLNGAIQASEVDAELLGSNIPGTTATVTMDGNGNPVSIVHTANNSAVRTDTFVWSTNSVVETRTLASGKYITLTTNLTTLETVVSAVQEVA